MLENIGESEDEQMDVKLTKKTEKHQESYKVIDGISSTKKLKYSQ